MLALPFEHTTVVLVVSVCLMAQKFLLAILPVDTVTEKLLVEINPVYITFYFQPGVTFVCSFT